MAKLTISYQKVFINIFSEIVRAAMVPQALETQPIKACGLQGDNIYERCTLAETDYIINWIMRQQIIIIIGLTIVLISGLWIRERFFPLLTRDTTFYFYSLFWISGVLIIALTANLLWGVLKTNRQKETRIFTLKWPNRRKSYRVVYPHSGRPVLLIDKHDGPLKRQLEYPVSDISEQGIGFINDGSLGPAIELDGNVRFLNGEMNRIVGHIVRRNGKFISVQLHAGFPWKKILEEQRRLISQMRHGSAKP